MSKDLLFIASLALVPTLLVVLAVCFIHLLPHKPAGEHSATPPATERPISTTERHDIRASAQSAALQQRSSGKLARNPYADQPMRKRLWKLELDAALAALDWQAHR